MDSVVSTPEPKKEVVDEFDVSLEDEAQPISHEDKRNQQYKNEKEAARLRALKLQAKKIFMARQPKGPIIIEDFIKTLQTKQTVTHYKFDGEDAMPCFRLVIENERVQQKIGKLYKMNPKHAEAI